ncbi:hypothetical protein XM38_026020 [Halomicronema hongdechloris C2206]|uniref:Uncharacterized protein n=1 Tax=Halomicronema hongdechloris C2206 TaxID=1641165 RepID=A0A1Z3HMW9_9CYAN|nr:hypothetical protein XM38_026020 [Halomicronema hongdechloris C2206]
MALEPVAIASFPLQETDETGCPTDPLRQLIDPWIHHLGQIDGLAKPAQSGIVPDIHYISLTSGQVCRAATGEVAWVRMQQGIASWMGNPAFPLTAELGCFPLGDGMFLQAQDHLEFFIRPTTEVRHRKILIRGLAQLHRYVFSTLALIQTRDQRLSLKRFQQRQRLNQSVTETVVRTLTGVLDPDDLSQDIESPLLAAAGAVGKALGVAIHRRPPQKTPLAPKTP